MMKKWGLRLALLLAYACPYVFWGMYGDAAYRSMKGYLPLLVCVAVLCWLAVRTRNIPTLLAGNALSFLSSCGFVLLYQTEKWDWYFKPFTCLGFLKMVSIAMLLAQGLVIYLVRGRENRAIKT